MVPLACMPVIGDQGPADGAYREKHETIDAETRLGP